MAYTPVAQDTHLPPIRINLLSDTQTCPTPAMRDAMARAEVGDEQLGLDPTVNALCERVAALLGKEAAVFMPTGTMCNVAALLAHARPGDEIIAHETAHILTSEGGAHAAFGGLQILPLKGPRGQFTTAALQAALRTPSRYAPRQRVVSAEQTANIGGGTIWPHDQLDAVARLAKAQGLATHLDGALRRHRHRSPRHGRALGHSVDRLHQGPRRPARRGAGRLTRPHRRGVADQAAARRRHAPGRHLRRGLPVCARSPRRPPRRRS